MQHSRSRSWTFETGRMNCLVALFVLALLPSCGSSGHTNLGMAATPPPAAIPTAPIATASPTGATAATNWTFTGLRGGREIGLALLISDHTITGSAHIFDAGQPCFSYLDNYPVSA